MGGGEREFSQARTFVKVPVLALLLCAQSFDSDHLGLGIVLLPIGWLQKDRSVSVIDVRQTRGVTSEGERVRENRAHSRRNGDQRPRPGCI